MAVIFSTILTYLPYIILSLGIFVYLFIKYSHSYFSRHRIPFAPPEFLFGNYKKSNTLKINFAERIVEIYNEYKIKGFKYIGTYFFIRPVLMVWDPDLLKNIMVKDFDHFVDRGVYHNEEEDPLSAHVLAIEGTKWKKLRQKLTPSFTSGKLKQMFQTLVDCTDELKDCLDESVAKAEPINIKQVLMKYTINVIGSCAFGIDCNSFQNPNSEFIRYGLKMFRPNIYDRIKLLFCSICPKTAKALNCTITNKEVDYFFRKLVRDTIQYREDNNVTRKDFMQLLLQLKNNDVLDGDMGKNVPTGTSLTIDEISAQSFAFFIAGFETSSTAMTFSLYELAKNPEIQEKARVEIVSVLNKYEGKITYDSVMEMPYLERVIQESLRKHPPAMFVQRICTQPYNLPDTDIVLEKSQKILIPILAIHYDPEYYPEPEKFDPERFTEENKKTRPDLTYLPFGSGPRNCIGLRFAMLETKVGLCRLLVNYKFSFNSKTIDPIVLDPRSIIRNVKGGIWLNAERITT